MPNYVCVTCGVQYGESEAPPDRCFICEDQRQYVHPEGQTWTTIAAIQADHRNVKENLEPGLTELYTSPQFGIGQRTLLVQGPNGNVLWDCVSLIDDETVEAVEALGGVSAMSMSHPHMFGSMVAWSHAFDGVPIHLHADFRKWVARPDPVIRYWEGEHTEIEAGVSLYRCGGHFKGSTVLFWPDGAGGNGALLSSDTLYVTPDLRHLAFMYSYPNYIPLTPDAVDRIVDTVMPLDFDRIYSHFHYRQVLTDGKAAVRRSADRYRKFVGAGME